jgi:hypothetical protein
MTVALRRLVVALAGGLLASGGLALAATPATSAPTAGACSDGEGVTVVVDFAALGGGVQTRCAPAPVTSGFDALTRAGFAITSVSGQAFLCRIDAKPADDPCNRIPSAARYWSYWHADRGEAWTYSSSGASRKPPPGSVEGWAFGGSDEPGAPPPGPITTPTSRPVTPPSTASPPTTGGAVVPPGPSTTVDPSEPGGSSTSAPTTASTTTEPPASDDELAAPDLTPTGSVRDDDAGSPVGVVAAALLVGGLAVIGVRTVRRRSRDEAAR